MTLGELFHGPGLDDPALLDDGYLVAELLRHIQHMGGKKTAVPFWHISRMISFQREGSLRIQSDKGLIQDEQLRFVYQRGDNRRLLLHAVGI